MWLWLMMGCEPLQSLPADALVEPGVLSVGSLNIYPDVLQFGDVNVQSEPSIDGISFTNTGTETITLLGVDEIMGDAAFSTDAMPVMQLLPGEQQTLNITFHPTNNADYQSTIWVSEIDGQFDIPPIEIDGRGTAAVVDAVLPEFPAAAYGCSSRFRLDIYNDGDEFLSIHDLIVDNSVDYTVTSTLESIIKPGKMSSAWLRFHPVWSGDAFDPHSTTISIETNDPITPSLSVDVTPELNELNWIEESFTYTPETDVDLLIVVDNGTAMQDYLDRARMAMDTLVAEVASRNINLHATVITGSATCPEMAGDLSYVTTTQSAFTQANVLSSGLDGEVNPSYNQLLVQAIGALENDTSGGCLDGFLREDALLHILMLTGGPDESGQDMDDIVDSISDLAPEAGGLMFSTISALANSPCDGVSPGQGYTNLAEDSEVGGILGNLCQEDWSPIFSDIASVSTRLADGGMTHVLGHPALEDSTSVTVNGSQWDAEQYSHDLLTQSIVFEDAQAPLKDSLVTVHYIEEPSCQP